MARKRTNTQKPTSGGQLRIIGGQWRGRKLSFPDAEGLRPTPDRVRETVFNWLAATVPGARCLDLFAGSGALGLEALSRGARWADLCELNPSAASQLQSNLQLLNCHDARVHSLDSTRWLSQQQSADSYDIIFLDPPFRTALADQCIAQLSESTLLRPGSQLYLEMGKEEILPAIPEHWRLYREKNAGQICYRLFHIE